MQGEAIDEGAAAVALGRVLEAVLVAGHRRDRSVDEGGLISPVVV